MTFILNILHEDMSLLAADRTAVPVAAAPSMRGSSGPSMAKAAIHNFRKITLNRNKVLAVGIAGHSHEHGYTPMVERSDNINSALVDIRNHVDRAPRIYERAQLGGLPAFMVNQGIATFFDADASGFFSYRYLFSPVEYSGRLHRGSGGNAKLLHVGSGSKYFEVAVGLNAIDAFISTVKHSCSPEDCIPWIRSAYERVSARDEGTGVEADIFVSTRDHPAFRPLSLR